MNETEYAGVRPHGTSRNPWRVMFNLLGIQKYAGVFPTLPEALEVWNNGAYYLNACGRGIRLPLQGTDSQIERYAPPKYVAAENVAEYIPAPTELTLGLVKWVEAQFPEVEAVTVRASATSGALVSGLKRFHADLDEFESQTMKAFARFRQTLVALSIAFDPETLKIERERRKCLEMLAQAPTHEGALTMLAQYNQKLGYAPDFRD